MLQTRCNHWGKATDQKPGFDRAAWYHCNHLGTPLEMTDEQGKIVWSARYEAFGKASVKMKEKYRNPIRFQGQYEDEETGLPSVNHPCVQQRLTEYGATSAAITNFSNLQQYLPESNPNYQKSISDGLQIGGQKAVLLKGSEYVAGQTIARFEAAPTFDTLGRAVSAYLGKPILSTLSVAAEIGLAFGTTYGSVLMSRARSECAEIICKDCGKK